MEKTGLVLEGGGLRGIYTAGVLDAMMTEKIWFPYVIGVSAGACNATSYLSRQEGRVGRVMLQNFMDKRYLSYKSLLLHGSIFGMDFIFNEIPNHLDPFDYDAFFKNPAEFELGVTNLLTGQPDYYAKERILEQNMALLCATSSMPMLSNIVNFHGQLYLDGAVSDSIPVRRALQQGCDKLVVVLTQPRGYVKKPVLAQRYARVRYRRYPQFLKALSNRHVMYNETLHFLEELEAQGKALVLAPKQALPFAAFEKNPQKMQQAYQMGMGDLMDAANRIRAFGRGQCP